MIVLHTAQTTSGETVKGYVVKMWGQHHIISEADENLAYPVIEETIKPVPPDHVGCSCGGACKCGQEERTITTWHPEGDSDDHEADEEETCGICGKTHSTCICAEQNLR